MQEPKKLFALDIGTRSIVGIILEEKSEQYHVVDILIQEHTERAMLDGQIHDVMAVSKIIVQIKNTLEKKHGPLKKVSVAAAGRSLKTERAQAAVNIKGKPMLNKQDILHLELSAVQQAQAIVAEKQSLQKSFLYYCVGYSILYYKLDGEEIGSLIDQQGDEASVEIIATFLPKVVVESLISALQRSGLEMEALTLEPIAAINVLIPPTMRRLNVALVDIGAGTSDIAITDLGTVIAYGMVPIAGDEITEAFSDQYLLDFPLAEKAKRELLENEKIIIQDILGFEAEISKADAVQQISPAINRLTAAICDEILSLNNQKQPKAVMLVGGGSQTPQLAERIAERLQLPMNRVAIRGSDAIGSLTFAEHIACGPELVTPIGIAIAAHKAPVQYKTVYVNEQPVRLFEVNKLTAGDCLLAAGIKMNKLYGKPGLAMIISLNGQSITIPGSYGEPPTMTKNGEQCDFDDVIESGDAIIVEKGMDGQKAQVQISDLIDEMPAKTISINLKQYTIPALLTVNGQDASIDTFLSDHDQILFQFPTAIDDLLETLKLSHLTEQLSPFRININGKETFIPAFSGKIVKNGVNVKPHSSFDNNDDITITKKAKPTISKLALMKQIMLSQSLPITFNGKPIELKKHLAIFKRNGITLSENDVIHEGDKLELIQQKFEPFLFQDIFTAVDISMPDDANGSFILLLNEEKANFHDKLNPGDKLELIWPLKKIQTVVSKAKQN